MTSAAPLQHLLRLTLRDLWHERWLAFCTACVLAATLAPLWTLWGLERGVIGTMIDRQNRDPVMRRVLPEATGSQKFDATWFKRISAWQEVAFAMPETRSIANQVDLFADNAPAPVRVDLLPTSPGDPLLGPLAVPAEGSLLLSQRAARHLGVAEGQTVTLALERERAGATERATLLLKVSGVMEVVQHDGLAALTGLRTLESIQSWRDGYTVAALGLAGQGPAPKMEIWPRFRAYARSIQEVAVLAERFEKDGVSVSTNAREISATLGLQSNLRAVLSMVAVIAASGAVIALTAMQISEVQRKRRDHALLQLTGHGRIWLISIPCMAASAKALVGAALAFGVYACAAGVINAYFANYLATNESAVSLGAAEIAWGIGAVWLMSVLPAIWGGWRASNVEAADVLRDN